MSALNAPIVAGLAALAVGGVAYVFLMPLLSGEKRAGARLQALGNPKIAVDRAASVSRREQVAKSLKEVEARKGKTNVTLELRIQRAGLSWSRQTFYLVSVGLAVLFGFGVFAISGNPIAAAAALFAGGLGAPRWLLGFRQKRRIKKFIKELPNAIDVIVRGIKSGIPLGDCLRIIAREAEEPVRSEFKLAIDAQQLGISMGEAVSRLFERVPVSDVNFFGIVISIQEKSGGNLSEALSNLSKVLRERAKMAGKIQAMSMEAKSSAGIIACLPVIVALLTYLSSPDYISMLWTTSPGKICLAGAALWMSIGVFTMKKMIEFDF